MWRADRILRALDACADVFSFPMLDNGYVYPAATRLAAFRSSLEWGLTIEVFGFNPRGGFPETAVYSFGSAVVHQRRPTDFVVSEAFETYIARNPFNEHHTVFALGDGPWRDPDNEEILAETADAVIVRGQRVELPDAPTYADFGIELISAPRVALFEMCRWLAATHRDDVLATPDERRAAMGSDLTLILQLDEWHHPDLADGERPSQAEAFCQLAQVLETGDVRSYVPTQPPNTHWKHWPEGGTL